VSTMGAEQCLVAVHPRLGGRREPPIPLLNRLNPTAQECLWRISDRPARVSANMRIVCNAVRKITAPSAAGRSKLYTFAHGEAGAHPEAAFLVYNRVAFEPFKRVQYISIASL
jgi:hypothetical protein